MKRSITGFTIVELLIVIVVVAILAAISIVAYNGIQQRARDSIRKQDLATIAKAFQLYNIDNQDWMGSGSNCGYNGNGWGWVNLNQTQHSQYASSSLLECLMVDNYLQRDIVDPSGQRVATPTTGFGYMKQHCGSGDTIRVYLYAKLESIPQSSAATDGTCEASFDTAYGMNYYVQVK